MKLYQYHHCPFCVRADMVANYKQVEHEKVFLANDDEQTCFDLIGAKMVPILELDDGTAMAESLDVCARFDELGDPAAVILDARPEQEQTAMALLDGVRKSIHCLLFPRNINLGLPEFASQASRDYFQNKKEAIIEQTFEQALADTDHHKAMVETTLAQLPALSLPADHQQQISWSDVIIYPTLRNLTMVKDLNIPPAVMTYLQQVASVTNTHLYLDHAI